MKFIKNFVGLIFVLSMLVTCFMSSTMVVQATIASGTYVQFCTNCNTTVNTTSDGRCGSCGRSLIKHHYSGSCTESWNEPNSGAVTCGCTTPLAATSPRELCPNCGHYAMRHSGASSGGGGGSEFPPAITHSHSYGPTSWGQWS